MLFRKKIKNTTIKKGSLSNYSNAFFNSHTIQLARTIKKMYKTFCSS